MLYLTCDIAIREGIVPKDACPVVTDEDGVSDELELIDPDAVKFYMNHAVEGVLIGVCK